MKRMMMLSLLWICACEPTAHLEAGLPALVVKVGKPKLVQPVYALGADEHPHAAALCEALHGGKIPFLRDSCSNALSLALGDGAVTIEPRDLERCRAVATPDACLGLLRGQRDVTDRCRSSLECRDGLFCAGAGPTQAGHCSAPLPPGHACGGQDALASYLGDTRAHERHPECRGACRRRRCTSDG